MWKVPSTSLEFDMEMKGKQSKMAGLFIYAAIIQGAIAALITFLGAFGDNSSLLTVPSRRCTRNRRW